MTTANGILDASALRDMGGVARDIALRQVGTRTRFADNPNTTNKQAMSRRAEVAPQDLTSIQLVYANFTLTSTGELDSGGTRTIAASIEYPAGTFTQVLFSGAATVVMTDGQARCISDAVAVSIPRGARYWVKTWQSGVVNGIFFQTFDVVNDSITYGPTVSDSTMSAFTGANTTPSFGPSAILATTSREATALLGDSMVQASTGATVGAYAGMLAPSFAPTGAVLDLAKGSQSAQQYAGSGFTKRSEYLQYASAAVLQLGFNDITAGRTAAQIAADRQTIRALAPSLTWFETTLTPKTTSTDSWATLTNQTIANAGQNTIRIAFNLAVRNGNAGFAGYFDMADAIESYRDSGIFKAPPMVGGAVTGDGTHPNDAGYALFPPYISQQRVKYANLS